MKTSDGLDSNIIVSMESENNLCDGFGCRMPLKI